MYSHQFKIIYEANKKISKRFIVGNVVPVVTPFKVIILVMAIHDFSHSYKLLSRKNTNMYCTFFNLKQSDTAELNAAGENPAVDS